VIQKDIATLKIQEGYHCLWLMGHLLFLLS
jgi:hypothetical protein